MSSSPHGSSARAILYAFLANLGIAIAKSAAAVYTSSGSMLAEAIHSFADCGNQLLLFIGLKQAEKPADDRHPLGYGKITYFWSFVVAILLFSMGGLFSIYEGWHKLHAPEPLNQAWVALVVLGISIILETFSLLGALKEIRLLRGKKSFRDWLRHTRNAELVVVLGEDNAALLGLLFAFVFVLIAMLTGNPVYDAIGSICIGVVLITISVFIGWRIKALIVGRSAEPDLVALIDAIIAEDAAIETCLNTITVQFGPQVMLALKLKMKPGMSLDTAVTHINALERKIKERAPAVGWCFIEPDSNP
jgi:cation diffusion facilitator family transporter